MANELKVERVPIDSVTPDPANARRHPERNLEAIKGSLARFGQQKPIVVTKDNVIRAGNGTWFAAKALGWAEIAVVRSDLQGAEAVGFAIADNRTGELAEWDEASLSAQLSALAEDGWSSEDLASVGWDPTDLAALAAAGGDASGNPMDPEPPGDFARVDEDIPTDYRCPKCGYEWSGSPGGTARDEEGDAAETDPQ